MPSSRSPLFAPQFARPSLVRGSVQNGFSPLAMNGLQAWFHPARGMTTDGAAALAVASSQYFTVSHHADWVTAGGFTAAGWCRRSAVGGTQYLAGKFATSQREWSLHLGSGGFIGIRASSDGTAQSNITSSLIVPAADTWAFVTLRYDATRSGAELAASCNAQPLSLHAHAGGLFAGTGNLRLGASDVAIASSFDGRLDAWGFWNRALSDAEITQLYNAGAGYAYEGLPATFLPGMIAWYDLAEASDTRFNRHQNNHHAVPNGTPTATAGIVTHAAGDEQTIAQWSAPWGTLGEMVATQSTATARPTREGSDHGDSLLSFDGTDDSLGFTPATSSSSAILIAWVSNPAAGFGTILGNGGNGSVFVRHASATQTLVSDGTTTITFTHAAQSGLGVHVINGDGAGIDHYFQGGAASSSSGGTLGAIAFDRIGMRGGGTPSYFQGDLGHVVVGNARLPIDQVNQLGRYLALRNQLAWTAVP